MLKEVVSLLSMFFGFSNFYNSHETLKICAYCLSEETTIFKINNTTLSLVCPKLSRKNL